MATEPKVLAFRARRGAPAEPTVLVTVAEIENIRAEVARMLAETAALKRVILGPQPQEKPRLHAVGGGGDDA